MTKMDDSQEKRKYKLTQKDKKSMKMRHNNYMCLQGKTCTELIQIVDTNQMDKLRYQ
jgi:hypothetical protein